MGDSVYELDAPALGHTVNAMNAHPEPLAVLREAAASIFLLSAGHNEVSGEGESMILLTHLQQLHALARARPGNETAL